MVAVLGYSRGRGETLHAIGAERLRHAETLSAGARAVVLSGRGEAELMRESWAGPEVPIVCDLNARSTAENAAAVAAAARSLGADEVLVVTSRWHSLRAGRLVRAALPGTDVLTSSPSSTASPRLLARELVCLVGLPVQALRLRRAATSAAIRSAPGRNASSSGGL
jgi:uncharacterized SAM-binding protein YcdF (DUF218 family)